MISWGSCYQGIRLRFCFPAVLWIIYVRPVFKDELSFGLSDLV